VRVSTARDEKGRERTDLVNSVVALYRYVAVSIVGARGLAPLR
jgi:hypothetical protein